MSTQFIEYKNTPLAGTALLPLSDIYEYLHSEILLINIFKFRQWSNKIETSDPYHQAEEAEFLKELGNQQKC